MFKIFITACFLVSFFSLMAQTAGPVSETTIAKATSYLRQRIAAAAAPSGAFKALKGGIREREPDGTIMYNIINGKNEFTNTQYLLQEKGCPLVYRAVFFIKATAAIIEAIERGLVQGKDTTDTYSYQRDDKGKGRGVFIWSIEKEGRLVAQFRLDKYRNIGYLEVPAFH